MERSLKVIEREGLEPFSQTFALQNETVESLIADRSQSDVLILVEHEPIYTTGRGVGFQSGAEHNGTPIPWTEIGRGGQATYHGPGQLVAYPIFDLEKHGRDVHVFLRKLEAAGSSALKSFGIEGHMRPGLTGIWVANVGGVAAKKVASIGIGVRRWVSYHGMAINLVNDLAPFRAISPCGQDGELVTSISEICNERGVGVPSMEALKLAFVTAIREQFDLPAVQQSASERIDGAKRKRPPWLKAKAPGSPQFLETNELVRKLNLVTVCEEARCPNMGECWSHKTATFMVMGELCTRRCSFCSVKDGTLSSLNPLDPLEPYRVGVAVRELGLKHVVITSVNRDDLPDMGALHFDATVRSIKKHSPDCNVELLIPDMRGNREFLATILQSGLVTVLNHNVETVPRLYKTVRPGAIFARSLNVLRWAKELHPDIKTKSGVMVGLGETKEEIVGVMEALREANVEIMTIGQYLQPTEKQLPVNRFVTPEEFADYEREGYARGFSYVESGPLVRSSYHAWQHAEGAVEHDRAVAQAAV